MSARPGPKPSGRNNAVKSLLDDDTYDAIVEFQAMTGSSQSVAICRALRLYLRGVASIVGDRSAVVLPANGNCGTQLHGVGLEIELLPEEAAAIEAVSERTGMPAEEIARALVCGGLFGACHPAAYGLLTLIYESN